MEKRWLDDCSQELIEKLMTTYIQLEEHYGHPFRFDLVKVMLSYFSKREEGNDVEKMTRQYFFGESPTSEIFLCHFLLEISRFKRTDAEADALVMVLLERIFETISQPIYAEMEARRLVPQDMMFFFEVDLMGFQ